MTDPSNPPNPSSPRRCTARKRNGKPCRRYAILGGKVCPSHGGKAPKVRAMAAVRAEVSRWGLADSAVEPGEQLLRLVSQSAARAERYARLLEQAYDAAERLREAHEAGGLLVSAGDDEESAAVQAARADLDRIFTTGGVSALVGTVYADSKTGGIFATGEQIRGLVKLEAEERDRCAKFASLAVAAGLAERQVRLAERQAEIVIDAIDAALDALGVPAENRGAAKLAAARHLKVVTS